MIHHVLEILRLNRTRRRKSSSDDPRLAALAKGDWRTAPIPPLAQGAVTMLLTDELKLLDHLAGDYFSGQGAIIDAGCFLGGSTLALANGLRRHLSRRGLADQPLIHSYDLFQVEDWTRGIYFPREIAAGASTRQRFDTATRDITGLIEVHAGDITARRWTGGPIEILFIDVAKHWTVCDWITANFFPALIPGKSIIVQQDYLFGSWTGWIHLTMEYFADAFDIITDTERNSVVFHYARAIAPERLRGDLIERMEEGEARALFARAAARWQGDQRALLDAAAAHYLEMRHGG